MRVKRKTILVHKHDFEALFHDVVSWNKDGVFVLAASNVFFFFLIEDKNVMQIHHLIKVMKNCRTNVLKRRSFMWTQQSLTALCTP